MVKGQDTGSGVNKVETTAGGDTAPHLSRRDEDVVGVGLVVVCFVALVWQATMRGLDQW